MFVQSEFKNDGKRHLRGDAWKGSAELSKVLTKQGLIGKEKPKPIGWKPPAPKSETKAEKRAAKSKTKDEIRKAEAKAKKEADAKAKKAASGGK